MKIKLSESQIHLINELVGTSHYEERYDERFNNIDEYNVIINDDINNVVAKYYIRDRERDIINDNINFVEKIDNVPIDVSAAIIVHEFKFNENNITFVGFTEEDRKVNRNRFNLSSSRTLSVMDSKIKGKGSIGKFLVMIIYKNTIQTIFLSKYDNDSYLLKRLSDYNDKNRLVVIHTLDSFQEKIKNAKTYNDIMSASIKQIKNDPIKDSDINKQDDKEKKRQYYLNSINKNMKIKLTESQIINILSEISDNDILNHILDKINSDGIESLSPEDKIKLRQLSGEKVKMPEPEVVQDKIINNEENEIRFASLNFIDNFPTDINLNFNGRDFHAEVNDIDFGDVEDDYDPTESNFIILSDGETIVKIYPFYNNTREFRILSNNGYKKSVKFNAEIPSNEESTKLFVRFFIKKTLPKTMQDVINHHDKGEVR